MSASTTTSVKPPRPAVFRCFCSLSLALLACCGFVQAAENAILIQNGQKVAFLGDSITAGGWGSPGGYVRLIVDGLAKEGIAVTPIPAGIGGNKSTDMLARLDKDALSKKPDWMLLSCGVNDVWHGANGVPLDAYKTHITGIVKRARDQGVNVMILTATPIGEEDNDNNRKLAAYNEFLRELAARNKMPLADLDAAFQLILKPLSPTKDSRFLTADGVHMNPEGNVIMARECLLAAGVSQEKFKAIENQWLDQPNTATIGVQPFDPRPDFGITLGQFRGLSAIAKKQNTDFGNLSRSMWLRALSAAVQAHQGEVLLNAEQIKKESNVKLQEHIAELLKK